MKATDRKEWTGLVFGAVLAVSIAGLLYLAFVTRQNCVAIKDMTVQLERITHQAVAPAIAPALIEHGVIIYQAPAPTTKGPNCISPDAPIDKRFLSVIEPEVANLHVISS